MMEPGTRRRWTPEEKLEIVLDGMRGDQSVSDVCRKHGLNPAMYYTWRDKLFKHAKDIFEHENIKPSRKEEELETDLAKAKEVINELVTENLELKKTRFRSMITRRR